MRPHQTLVLPDTHIPFHNVKLVNKVLRLCVDYKFDSCIILGDFGDYYSTSRHHKGSLGLLRSLTLGKEYDAQNKVLDSLDSALGPSCTYKGFIEGNHEDNVTRWLNDGDNAKMAGAVEMPPEALKLEKRGWDYHPNWREASITVGNHLELIHGEYCTVHSAKKHLDEYDGSVMFGHTHRFQSHVTGRRGSYNIGWLGDKTHPAFGYASASQRRRWVNGFAVVTTLDDGSFIPHPVQCWQDKFGFNGRIY